MPYCMINDAKLGIGISGLILFCLLFLFVVCILVLADWGKLTRDVLVPLVGVGILSCMQISYWTCFLVQGTLNLDIYGPSFRGLQYTMVWIFVFHLIVVGLLYAILLYQWASAFHAEKNHKRLQVLYVVIIIVYLATSMGLAIAVLTMNFSWNVRLTLLYVFYGILYFLMVVQCCGFIVYGILLARQHRAVHPDSGIPIRLYIALLVFVVFLLVRVGFMLYFQITLHNLDQKMVTASTDVENERKVLKQSFIFPGHVALFRSQVEGLLFYIFVVMLPDFIPWLILIFLWVWVIVDVRRLNFHKPIGNTSPRKSIKFNEKLLYSEISDEEEGFNSLSDRYADY